MTILLSVFSLGYCGKTVNMECHSEHHRTSLSRFLRSDSWSADLKAAMKKFIIKIIYEGSKHSGKPILCIIDDTIASKTIPSSKAKHPMDAAYFHFSHLKKEAGLRTSGSRSSSVLQRYYAELRYYYVR